MSEERNKATVTIGCKLPAGLVLIVDYVQDRELDGKKTRVYEKGPNYGRHIIRGWNHHSIAIRKQLEASNSSAGVAHGMNTTPYLNRGVPKDLWERWKKEHPRSWLLRNQLLFEVASGDEASAALRVSESTKTPTVFEPIDSTKVIVPGIKPLEREEM